MAPRINPNTNPNVTAKVAGVATRIVEWCSSVTVFNPQGGPFSIESRADRDDAEPRVAAMIRETLSNPYDGYVLACFDDIAVDEARTMLHAPVIGTCEAGIAAIRTLATRFSVITTVHPAIPTIEGLLARYGASDICTVRSAGVGVAAAASENNDLGGMKISDAVRAAISDDGAEAILLGSGGLVGQALRLQQEFGLPVIDGVAAAARSPVGTGLLET